jgi:hypothetical protein
MIIANAFILIWIVDQNFIFNLKLRIKQLINHYLYKNKNNFKCQKYSRNIMIHNYYKQVTKVNMITKSYKEEIIKQVWVLKVMRI